MHLPRLHSGLLSQLHAVDGMVGNRIVLRNGSEGKSVANSCKRDVRGIHSLESTPVDASTLPPLPDPPQFAIAIPPALPPALEWDSLDDRSSHSATPAANGLYSNPA
uniref:Uncharacterized protein n=1 Tax=Parascaris equorum TaxID=6256 RepID=A0A914R513_PAREQ